MRGLTFSDAGLIGIYLTSISCSDNLLLDVGLDNYDLIPNKYISTLDWLLANTEKLGFSNFPSNRQSRAKRSEKPQS